MDHVRHIHIESGALKLDYRGSGEQVQNVADELMGSSEPEWELRVSIDDKVTDELPLLPCSGLWE